VLLTGRMRPIDKDDVIKQLVPLKSNSDARVTLEHPLMVVATQTLEVGADLDFDGLVSECASLDALRQRFGRLNRAGRPIEARATIVVRDNQASPRRSNDPIYGTALAETWQWLREHSQKGEINLGYEDFDRLLPSDDKELDSLLRRLAAPAPDAPVMLPAHVDAWVQTCPTPLPDPDVSLFLHGPGRGAPEVQVCWRADLLEGLSLEQQVDIVSLCPPASSECISVPVHILRGWLRGEGSTQHLSDLEGGHTEDAEVEGHRISRNVLCWRGPEESYLITDPTKLSPGDTVVIPVGLGGWDVFGHIPPRPDGREVIDLGDRAHLQSRAIPVLRIHHKTVVSWPACPARDALLEIAEKHELLDKEDEIRELLRELATTEDISEWLQDAADVLGRDPRLKVGQYPDPVGGIVLRGSGRVPKYTGSGATLTSEDDSSSATVEVSLEEHLRGVEDWAARFGQGVGLPAPLVEDLALAAKLHDVGKADRRFQALLHGGNLWAAQAAGVLLAKSGGLPTSRRELQRASRESGYPHGGRHELLSVHMVERTPVFLGRAHDRELVLHLISSHHGRCRPFAPVVNDSEPLMVEATIFGSQISANSNTGLEQLDSGVPERFWRLVRRYGWWGLAWLEALMRLADHRRSEEEQERSQSAEAEAMGSRR
jgi:CRISPR-associated endonuclease/helicase Cas3